MPCAPIPNIWPLAEFYQVLARAQTSLVKGLQNAGHNEEKQEWCYVNKGAAIPSQVELLSLKPPGSNTRGLIMLLNLNLLTLGYAIDVKQRREAEEHGRDIVAAHWGKSPEEAQVKEEEYEDVHEDAHGNAHQYAYEYAPGDVPGLADELAQADAVGHINKKRRRDLNDAVEDEVPCSPFSMFTRTLAHLEPSDEIHDTKDMFNLLVEHLCEPDFGHNFMEFRSKTQDGKQYCLSELTRSGWVMLPVGEDDNFCFGASHSCVHIRTPKSGGCTQFFSVKGYRSKKV